MNEDINTLDFALVVDKPFAEIFGTDKAKKLKECTPASWVGERQWEDASHDCA